MVVVGGGVWENEVVSCIEAASNIDAASYFEAASHINAASHIKFASHIKAASQIETASHIKFASYFKAASHIDVISHIKAALHMGSFPHPMQYFAAADENDDFVIAVINFQLNQYFWKFLCYLFGYENINILNMKANENF